MPDHDPREMRAMPSIDRPAPSEAVGRIRRAVPDLTSVDLARSREFYRDFLGFNVGMDLGWVINFVSPDNPTAQVIVMSEDRSAGTEPNLTIEVDDVDRLHGRAVELGLEVVHPLTDEPWGVRRFFVKDPDGNVVNVVSHRDPAG
jgi:catechol 2,3-dioxygenase-like lactoylglutathione lyase family enzyme